MASLALAIVDPFLARGNVVRPQGKRGRCSGHVMAGSDEVAAHARPGLHWW